MFEFEVALLPSAKDCFVRVPAALAQELLARGSSRVVLRLETDDWRTGTRSSLLVSWEGSVSAGERVEVASGFWGALRAGSRVQLEPVDAPPDCGIVCVEPLTCDDWEMLELNAGHLEEQILNQAFVLSAGQVFPLWIFGKQLVNLAVKSLNCGPCGLLRPDTSFVVEPKPRRSKRPSSASAAAAASQLMRPVTLRVLPAAAAGEERPGYAAAACEDWSDGAVVWVSNPHPPLRRQEGEESVSRLVLRAARDPAVPRGCVRLAAEAMLALQLLPWARVQVFPSLQGPDGGAKSCQLTVMSRKKLDAGPLWEAFMGRSATRVFSHGTLVELAPQLLARLGLKEAEGEFVLGELLKHAERTVTFAAPPPHLAAEAVRPLSPRAEQLVGAEAAARRLAAHVLFYARHPLRLGKLAVVSGGIGSGKSALVRAVCGSVPELYTEIVDCERLVAEKLSAVRGALTDAVLRCHGNFPGCLVLENLHLLCPENDEASLRPQQLAEALVNLLRSGRLVAVAAVPSAELLHPLVRQLAVCGTTVAIEALGRDSRRELARRVAEELQLRAENAVLEYVADATDGFCPGDIRSLLQRIPRDDFSERAVAEAKKLSTPSNLLGIKLHKSKVRFEQIGGLAAAKMTLRETLGYPKTHAKLLKVWFPFFSVLFASFFVQDSPIKLPTGVLLYGPPGSGKTMLASASAQEFGLNAICVSGPELLSKYIGQSEQSVRELFHRAKQCKPSVIVFDEFDRFVPPFLVVYMCSSPCAQHCAKARARFHRSDGPCGKPATDAA